MDCSLRVASDLSIRWHELSGGAAIHREYRHTVPRTVMSHALPSYRGKQRDEVRFL